MREERRCHRVVLYLSFGPHVSPLYCSYCSRARSFSVSLSFLSLISQSLFFSFSLFSLFLSLLLSLSLSLFPLFFLPIICVSFFLSSSPLSLSVCLSFFLFSCLSFCAATFLTLSFSVSSLLSLFCLYGCLYFPEFLSFSFSLFPLSSAQAPDLLSLFSPKYKKKESSIKPKRPQWGHRRSISRAWATVEIGAVGTARG